MERSTRTDRHDEVLIDAHAFRVANAIDREGTLSRAAASLNLSQPSVTQYLQRIERRLGLALVERDGRSIRLTAAGRILAEHAPAVEAAMRDAARDLDGLRDAVGEASRVRIVAEGSHLAELAPALAAKIGRIHAAVSTEWREGARDEAIAAVTDGAAEIAIVATSADGDRSAKELATTTIATDELVLAMPRILAPTGRRCSLDEAVRFDIPLLGATPLTTELDVPAPGEISQMRSIPAALGLVATGTAIALLTVSDGRCCRIPDQVRIVHLDPPLRLRVDALARPAAAESPTVALVLQLLSEITLERHLPTRRGAVRFRSAHLPRLATAPASASEPHPDPRSASRPDEPPHPEPEGPAMPTALLPRALKADALATATALALAGCTGPQKTEVGPDTGEEIPAITVALPGSVSSLYVGQEAGILNYYLASISQEGLTTLDAQGKPQPALAESWDTPDATTYVFHLRKDAQFQDGTDVTADDVAYSLQVAADPEKSPGLAPYLGDVESVSAKGEHDVEVKLVQPNASFASNMSSAGAAFITSKKFWDEHAGSVGSSQSLVLGTGPYQVKEFVPDSHVTYERVDTWWGGSPKVKEITVKFIPDESTRLLAAKSGDIDLAFNVPLQQSQQWEQLGDMRVEYQPDLSYVGMYFNTTVAPFDDPKIREAFAQSLDRKAVVDSLLRGHGEVATSLMTPQSLGGGGIDEQAAHDKLATIPQWEFDLDKAKEALAASTKPDGFTTDMIVPSTGPHLVKAAQSLAENLAKIGITLNVREVPIEEYLASIDVNSDYGVGFMWFFSTLGDPGELANFVLGPGNLTGYENPEVQDLIVKSNGESDFATRIDLLVQAETIQSKDAIHVPLWWGQSATAFKNDLGLTDLSAFSFVSNWPTKLYRAGQ